MARNTALYRRIADQIRHDIASRVLPAHSRLPSEAQLVKTYGAARETVRRALAQLQEDGVIYVRQAVGSFVAEPRVEQDLDQLVSFTEFMVHRGLEPGSKILIAERSRIEEPDSPILHYLRLQPGAWTIHLKRLRLGSGEPLVIASTWLPDALFPGFLQQDLRRHSVYEIMASMGHKPTDAIQTIEGIILEQQEAGLLTVPLGSPALLIRRVSYASGLPVEYALDHYRGDRTRFRVRLGVLEKRLSQRLHQEDLVL